jgi:tRNA (uracil-5-)-methyltransferase
VTKQALISVVVSDGYELDQSLKEKMKIAFDRQLDNKKVVSLSLIYSSELSGGYKETDRVEQLFGSGHYEEILAGIRFKVSPFAFFQVNTPVFEAMLQKIKDFAGIDEETTLFDICCGTGAIGLCLSQYGCYKVIGVDIVKQAIENANENVKMNQHIFEGKEIEFYAGRAEDVLPDLCEKQHGKIVGIVDPPRSGLHPNVLKALRTCKGLDRLVYVSCNAQSQM